MKTNAMRILDKNKIAYNVYEYNPDMGTGGVSVAGQIGKSCREVFKTLITRGRNNHYCFIIPVHKELDLSLASKAAGEKSIAMIKQADLKGITGYIKGGCSPIGQKKQLPTFIDISCKDLEAIVVSGGKIGIQIQLETEKLLCITSAKIDILV